MTPSSVNSWRRQKWPAETLMLSFRKISGKTWFYFLENPAKLHYDSIQAFDSNKYEYTCSLNIVENHDRFCFLKTYLGFPLTLIFCKIPLYEVNTKLNDKIKHFHNFSFETWSTNNKNKACIRKQITNKQIKYSHKTWVASQEVLFFIYESCS